MNLTTEYTDYTDRLRIELISEIRVIRGQNVLSFLMKYGGF